eukprot:8396398-Karenia_brevis.AAC.1
MQKGYKKCVLDPSTREFPIAELHGRVASQFGQRVHLEPANMRHSTGGWRVPPISGEGYAWGRAISSQLREPEIFESR